jgi:hypothetical protein
MKEAGPWTENRPGHASPFTFAIDWRFVMAIVILVVFVLLLLK